METIIVKKDATYGNPWFVQYTIPGWGNPAGEVYDLKGGEYLALVNSASTGYTRKVFKKSLAATSWIQNKLREQFPANELKFEVTL